VVQRVGVLWITVAGSEVDGANHADFAATADVVQERWDGNDISTLEVKSAGILVATLAGLLGVDKRQLEIAVAILDLTKGGLGNTDLIVSAVLIPVVTVKHDGTIKITTAELLGAQGERVPDGVESLHDGLGLVNRDEVGAHTLVDDNVRIALAEEIHLIEVLTFDGKSDLKVRLLHLFSKDRKSSCLHLRVRSVDQILGEGAAGRRHNSSKS